MLTVSILRNSVVVISKTLTNPQSGDVTAAITDLLFQLRTMYPSQPLWPFQIDVR